MSEDKFWLCNNCGRRPTYFPNGKCVCNWCESNDVVSVSDPGPLMHVFGQSHYHSEVHIVLNRASLVDLKSAIEGLLYGDKQQTRTMFCNDGEGFELTLLIRETNWDERGVPYTSDYASEKREKAIWPWEEVE